MSKLLSVCIIAKDAAEHIRRTVESVRDVADEVILVVDARTTDDTEGEARMACDRGAGGPGPELKIERRRWTHSYSEARNRSIDLAEGEFILAMDADEDLDPEDAKLLRKDLARYRLTDVFTCPLYLDSTYRAACYQNDRFGGQCGITWRNRIFRRASGARYRLRVHETLAFPPDRRDTFKEEIMQARFYHRGRLTEDKHGYYTALMLLDHLDDPSEPVPAIKLADDAAVSLDPVRAARFLEAVDPQRLGPFMAGRYWDVKGKLCQVAMRSLTMDGRAWSFEWRQLRDEALNCFRASTGADPTDPAAAVHAGVLLFTAYRDRDAVARELFEKLLARDPGNTTAEEILALYDEHGDNRQVFLDRLGRYLMSRGHAEKVERRVANGYSGDASIARLEELDEILGPKEAPTPAPASLAAPIALGDN